MSSLRSMALAVGGIVILASVAVFTFSLTLFVGAILSMALITRMVSSRMKQARVHVKASHGKTRRQADPGMRIWNDGRGTIIDL